MSKIDLEEIYLSCEKRWGISFENTEINDNYINDFKQNFLKFISNNSDDFQDADKILKELSTNLLNKFQYFSRQNIRNIYSDFYKNLDATLTKEEQESLIYSPIISSNKVKINSSYSYLEIYKEVANISSQKTIDFAKAPEQEKYLKYGEREELLEYFTMEDVVSPLSKMNVEIENNVDCLYKKICDIYFISNRKNEKKKEELLLILNESQDKENSINDENLENIHKFYLEKKTEIESKKKDEIQSIHDMHIEWLKEKLEGVTTVIHFDDICGSGDTLIKYLKRFTKVLSEKIVIVHFLVMTEDAWKKINLEKDQGGSLESYKHLEIIFYKMSEGGSIHQKATAYLEHVDINSLKKFEKQVVMGAELEKGNNKKKVLGYKGSQCLCAFFGNCPNNTLSSYWFKDNKLWNPLFPRRDDQHDYTKNLSLAEMEEKKKSIYQKVYRLRNEC